MKEFKIVNIGHYLSRSGTVYLHSLLDGHPEIITIPGVINFNHILKNNFKTSDDVIKAFEIENPKFYDTSTQKPSDIPDNGLYNLGENKNEKILTDKELFNKNFKEEIYGKNLSTQQILISLNVAYAKTHNKIINNCKVILLHPHEKNFCIQFNKIFPNSKFIIPVRNPIKTYNSIIRMVRLRSKLRSQEYYPSGQLIQAAIGLQDFKKHKMDMYVLKFENIGKNLKKEMKKICEYIGVSYHSTILESTFGGKKFWGNTFTNPRNKFNEDKYDINILLKKRDLKILNLINEKIIKTFDYNDKINSKKNSSLIKNLVVLLPLEDEIKFLKKISFKSFLIYLKFIIFYFPKRFFLIYTIFKNRFN